MSAPMIALGTAQFGMAYGIANQSGQVPREEVARILAMARDQGIDTLDTAMDYGNSETCLGECGVAGFNIITKLSALPDEVTDVEGWVRGKVQACLQRLRVPAVRGLLLHRPHQLTGPRGPQLARALQSLKADGLVEQLGVSIYSPAELGSVLPACPIDVVQAPFSLVDRRLHTSDWLQKLHDAGVEVHVRSAFLQGLLLMPRAGIPGKFEPWATTWDAWHAWLARHEVPAVQACLGFVRSFAQVHRIVAGVDSVGQFQQLVSSAHADIRADWPAIGIDDEALVNPSKWSGR